MIRLFINLIFSFIFLQILSILFYFYFLKKKKCYCICGFLKCGRVSVRYTWLVLRLGDETLWFALETLFSEGWVLFFLFVFLLSVSVLMCVFSLVRKAPPFEMIHPRRFKLKHVIAYKKLFFVFRPSVAISVLDSAWECCIASGKGRSRRYARVSSTEHLLQWRKKHRGNLQGSRIFFFFFTNIDYRYFLYSNFYYHFFSENKNVILFKFGIIL